VKHKFYGYVVLALIGFYIVTAPVQAAGTGKRVLAGAGHAAASVITFLTALAG
jgi:hypothetical protein